MNETLLEHSVPVYCLEIARHETSLASIDALCKYFRACIQSHPSAVFIAEFDHLAHTRSLPDGQVDPEIRAARNLIFCFGITLPDPRALAMRPRSIGIAETDRGFWISFQESPMPVVNAAMEDWAAGLLANPDKQSPRHVP